MAAEWAAILAVVGKALAPRVPGQTEPAKAAMDRALRLVKHVEKIVPHLDAADVPTRLDLVRIAALYVSIPLAKARKDEPADDVAELATDQLKNLVTEEELEILLRILRDYQRRDSRLPEAKLLSDVVALEDVGLVGLWNGAGRYQAMGRSLEQFIRLWKTQAEYGYWQTRLRDGFHLAVARELARQRLARLGDVIAQMEIEQTAADVG